MSNFFLAKNRKLKVTNLNVTNKDQNDSSIAVIKKNDSLISNKFSNNKYGIRPDSSTRPNSSQYNQTKGRPESSTRPNSSQYNQTKGRPESSTRPNSSQYNQARGRPESSTRPNSSQYNQKKGRLDSRTIGDQSSNEFITRPNSSQLNYKRVRPDSKTQDQYSMYDSSLIFHKNQRNISTAQPRTENKSKLSEEDINSYQIKRQDNKKVGVSFKNQNGRSPRLKNGRSPTFKNLRSTTNPVKRLNINQIQKNSFNDAQFEMLEDENYTKKYIPNQIFCNENRPQSAQSRIGHDKPKFYKTFNDIFKDVEKNSHNLEEETQERDKDDVNALNEWEKRLDINNKKEQVYSIEFKKLLKSNYSIEDYYKNMALATNQDILNQTAKRKLGFNSDDENKKNVNQIIFEQAPIKLNILNILAQKMNVMNQKSKDDDNALLIKTIIFKRMEKCCEKIDFKKNSCKISTMDDFKLIIQKIVDDASGSMIQNFNAFEDFPSRKIKMTDLLRKAYEIALEKIYRTNPELWHNDRSCIHFESINLTHSGVLQSENTITSQFFDRVSPYNVRSLEADKNQSTNTHQLMAKIISNNPIMANISQFLLKDERLKKDKNKKNESESQFIYLKTIRDQYEYICEKSNKLKKYILSNERGLFHINSKQMKYHMKLCDQIKDVNKEGPLFEDTQKQNNSWTSFVKNGVTMENNKRMSFVVPESYLTNNKRVQAILNTLMKQLRGVSKDHTLLETAGNPRITNGWAKLRNYYRNAGYLKNILNQGTRDIDTNDLYFNNNQFLIDKTPMHLRNEKYQNMIKEQSKTKRMALHKFNSTNKKYHIMNLKAVEKENSLIESRNKYKINKQKKIVLENSARLFYNNMLHKNVDEIKKVGLSRILIELLKFRIILDKLSFPPIFDKDSKRFIIDFSKQSYSAHNLDNKIKHMTIESDVKLDIFQTELEACQIEELYGVIKTKSGLDNIEQQARQKYFWKTVNQNMSKERDISKEKNIVNEKVIEPDDEKNFMTDLMTNSSKICSQINTLYKTEVNRIKHKYLQKNKDIKLFYEIMYLYFGEELGDKIIRKYCKDIEDKNIQKTIYDNRRIKH